MICSLRSNTSVSGDSPFMAAWVRASTWLKMLVPFSRASSSMPSIFDSVESQSKMMILLLWFMLVA